MASLKGLALGILGSLLFLSLSVFGLAFTVDRTVLNPGFLKRELDRVDVSLLVEETVNEQLATEDWPEELQIALINTIDRLEPLIKEEISAASYPVYDYMRGKSDDLDLAMTLRNTLFDPEFLVVIIDEIDTPALADEIISEQVSEDDFPLAVKIALIDTIIKLEPMIKEQVVPVADPLFDYLLEQSQSLDLVPVLGDTFLNSEFVADLIDRLDLPSLTEGVLSQMDMDFPEEFNDALVNTIADLEPLIKEQVIAATDPVFDYLLGERQTLDLQAILRSTLLNTGFIVSLIDNLDVSYLAAEFYEDELIGAIPEEMQFLSAYLDDAIEELEPTIKEELKAAAAPITDYLLEDIQSINVEIPFEPVITDLKEVLRGYFETWLPAEYAGLSQSQLDQLFDDYYDQLVGIIPASFTIDEELIGTEMPSQITTAISSGEDALLQVRQEITGELVDSSGIQQARQDISEIIAVVEGELEEYKPYVGYFLLGYRLLMVFIVLLIIAIILINRQVKDICRSLGITFLTYGALELIGIFVGKYFFHSQLLQTNLYDIPASLQGIPEQIFSDFLSPLLFLSIGFTVAGIALIVTSFLYNPNESIS
ncbi:MAG: hypothetical protein JSW16_07015 [Dehalococcoidales bacterium]|nr:MAG: hypothetical protein JSW16_07015 [Dehalococcoidales bacterium]